ncbi:prevent-host-death protein [Paramagnetospirillum marisnigri]|uniref:Antitoxin n=1 Tax=Paramagnetospirillum marisnigri TaxID=1285242 RepID=A0A178MSA7_9PROT|nr:type II toxin-antitoxin system prevent-host-death family antitoxin [Paramagnetospirillum marisnigri]OAN51119.1 prevent-host-death protein [Paramagnetospirillum marisnigri]
MQQVTIHAAKTHLSRLIEAALAGEEIIIANGSRPVVRLVPVSQGKFKLGLLKDKLTGPGPDFLAPMDGDDLALWEGGG